MGRRFHQYEMGEQIGSGGMASVYWGRNVNLDSPVAIKILHPALTYDAGFLARFEQEARTTAAIQSPNIVNVIDSGSENDTYFIVMELVDGADMARIFADLAAASGGPTPLPPEICLLILEEVAYGLRAAHEKGIWHRDIKPSNIMLDRQGCVRVTDFGLARDSGRAPDLDLTRTGIVLGTPSYMSPEQAAGEKLDGRTDVFSLGVVAYQWLSGSKPFIGSPSEVQQKIIDSEPAPLSTTELPWITPQMQALLDGSLHKLRDKRFPTMDAFLAALRAAMESIDPGGRIAINRREHLRRFAQDPHAAAQQLRHDSVQVHLRRGLLLKDMGLDKLDDALFEFRYVRALEPANEKANEALRELERRHGNSGSKRSVGPDGTRVLPRIVSGSAVVASEEPRRRRVPRRWLWLAVAIPFVMLALLALRGMLRPSRDLAATDPEPSAAPALAQALPALRDTSAGETAVPGDPPATATSIPEASITVPVTGRAAEAAPPVVAAPPRVTWSVQEEVTVLLDGAEIWRGSGKGGGDLAPDRIGNLLVRDESTFASLSQSVGPLAPGQVQALGPLVFARGRLQIFGRDGMMARIDGREIDAIDGTTETFPIGEGDHVLSVCMPGRTIKAVTIVVDTGSTSLSLMDSKQDCADYRFTITRGLLHKIAIRSEKAGG
ncbi:MAG: serine/threonine protein kinase [bacterium]|nr:serine/threonine protein kinase [bacterium]